METYLTQQGVDLKYVNLTLSHAALNTSGVMRCRFGLVTVPATLLDGAEHVRCVSPSAAQAGALPHRLEEFETPPQNSRLLGVAKA